MQKANNILIRICFCAIKITICLIAIAFLFVRGPFIKKPLEIWLSDKLNTPVSIEKIQYNLLYPTTISLYKLATNDIKVEELYLDINKESLITNKFQKFEINDLDIIEPQITIDTNDFKAKYFSNNWIEQVDNIRNLWIKNLLTKEQLKITFKAHDLENANEAIFQNNNYEKYLTKITDLKIENLKFNEQIISSINVNQDNNCSIFKCPFKSEIHLNKGSITLDGYINYKDKEITAKNLKLFNQDISYLENWNVPDWKLIFNEIQANNTNIKANDWHQLLSKINDFSGTISEKRIQGKFGEINIGITTIVNGIIEANKKHGIKLSGFIDEAPITITASYISSPEENNTNPVLDIEDISINNLEFNITSQLIETLKNLNSTTKIKHFQCNNCNILSDLENLSFFTHKSNIDIKDLFIQNYPYNHSIKLDNLSINQGTISFNKAIYNNPILTTHIDSANGIFLGELTYDNNSKINFLAQAKQFNYQNILKSLNQKQDNSSEKYYDFEITGQDIKWSKHQEPILFDIYGNHDFKIIGNISIPNEEDFSYFLTPNFAKAYSITNHEISSKNTNLEGINVHEIFNNIEQSEDIQDFYDIFNKSSYSNNNAPAIDEISNLKISINHTKTKENNKESDNVIKINLKGEAIKGPFIIDVESQSANNEPQISLNDILKSDNFSINMKYFDEIQSICKEDSITYKNQAYSKIISNLEYDLTTKVNKCIIK